MFYDIFLDLCKRKGVSCHKAALEIGLSNATPTTWKKRGLTPKGETLAKIADYFDVSVEYLLGTGPEHRPASSNDILDDIDVAFYGDYQQLDESDKETLRAMARIMRERREKKRE